MFRKGCEVVNLAASEWGVGTVLQQEAEGRVRVHFEHAGEKLLALNHARLVAVGTGIGPALELGRASKTRVNVESIGTFPMKYE